MSRMADEWQCMQEQEIQSGYDDCCCCEHQENLSGLSSVTNHEPLKTWVWHERNRTILNELAKINKQMRSDGNDQARNIESAKTPF